MIYELKTMCILYGLLLLMLLIAERSSNPSEVSSKARLHGTKADTKNAIHK